MPRHTLSVLPEAARKVNGGSGESLLVIDHLCPNWAIRVDDITNDSSKSD